MSSQLILYNAGISTEGSGLRVAALTTTGARLVRPHGILLCLLRLGKGVAKFPDKGDHPDAYGDGDPARDDYILHTHFLRADARDALPAWHHLFAYPQSQHAAQLV